MLPRPHPSVVFKAVSEGAVLLHTESEVYFGLNHVGAQVWELVADGCDQLDTVIGKVAETYPDVSAEVIRGDVSELIKELTENGLLIPPGGENAPGQPAP